MKRVDMEKGKTMDDYIKREDAIEAIEDTDWYHINSQAEMVHGANSELHQAWYKAIDIYSAIDSVPSADVAPVRHGHWIFNQDDMALTCSYCGDIYNIDDVDGGLDFMDNAKYCMTCGARMDGERKDDE